MKKRKNRQSLSPAVVKFILFVFFSFLFGLMIAKAVFHVVVEAPYFRIKTIRIDPSLQFIHPWDIEKLEGRNIFFVDLKEIQQRLRAKYPQVQDLKVMRMFPDEIYVSARQRLPFVQAEYRNKTITLDEKGVILSTASKPMDQLPRISGIKLDSEKVAPGDTLIGQDVQTALRIIKAFQAHAALSSHRLSKIRIENLSEINVTMDDALAVIVDRDNITAKLNMLSLVLSQGQIDVNTVNYIDLRFKEPILGKKPEETVKTKGKKQKK